MSLCGVFSHRHHPKYPFQHFQPLNLILSQFQGNALPPAFVESIFFLCRCLLLEENAMILEN